MSAELRVAPNSGPADSRADAIYFDAGDHRLFGWLHRPRGGSRSDFGLVVCKPFGYEAICAHRSMAAFADAAAELGFPTLRFDYLGTGDSPDIDPQADQVDIWSSDIVAAASELQRLAGVGHVCLLGFRLGALLATLAASRCDAITSLALVSPIVSGRRYLRELRTVRLAASMGAVHAGSARLAPMDAQPAAGGSVEVSGFSFSAATQSSLMQVDLTKIGVPPASDMLIIDSVSLPAARAWIDSLSATGIRTEYQALPGMVEMLMTDPQFAVAPQPMVATTCDWLSRLQSSQPVSAEKSKTDLRSALTAAEQVLQIPGDGASHDMLSERPVVLGSEVPLFGIVTEPRRGDKRRRGVILLNVGAEHHIGSSRMYVSLARRWSRHGYTVLRLDLAGLGDSATRPGRPTNEVFPPAAIDDIRAAVEHMQSRYGISDITLAGLCSGAYHSLRAAVAALPVNRILLINPMNFLWSESLSAENLQLEVDVARNVGFYRNRMFSAEIWKRIFTGRLNVWRIVRIVMQRPLLNLESRVNDLARTLGIHLPRDLGWELQEIAARGVKMVFVFARGEPGIDVLKLQAGSSLKRLGDHCLVHIVDSADHIFSHAATRVLLERILSDELFVRNPWSGSRSAAAGAGP